ncbi:DUF2017 family protein [Microbacterium sp. NPDC089987]|uniref:DUF2017 family protein n=1 Tax=Microbacterium sp. NPDC089987 TaxID=3364202 RepID=UPI0038110D27
MSVSISIAWIEGRNLLHLIDEFLELVAGPRMSADPALARLAPVAYPDDDAAAAEFRRGTRDELFDRRREDALVMRRDLVEFDDGDDDAGGRDALAPHEVDIAPAHVDPWMRTLTAIRLVVASRLGVDHDDRHDPEDPRFHVYDWLGYRLDDLIQRADDADDEAASTA